MKPIWGGGIRFETPQELEVLKEGLDTFPAHAPGVNDMRSAVDVHLGSMGDTEPFPPFDLAEGPAVVLEGLVGMVRNAVSAVDNRYEVRRQRDAWNAAEQDPTGYLAHQMMDGYRVEADRLLSAIPEGYRDETRQRIEEQRAPGE